MARVKIYSTSTCKFCDKAKSLLTRWKIPYDEIRVDNNPAGFKEMIAITSNARTVPQITIDGKWIGGFDELTEKHMEGELDELIQK